MSVDIPYTDQNQKEILNYLTQTVAPNCKPNYEPNHGSWPNLTVSWRAQNGEWLVRRNDRSKNITVECVDKQVEIYIVARWG